MTALTNNELTDDVLEYVLAVVEDRYENRKSNAGEDDRIILALRELQKRRKASKEPVRYLNKFSGVCVTLEQQPNASDDVAVYMPLYAAPPASEREQVRREHAEWSDKTFGDIGPVGPLKHLSKEALEAAADPSDPLEWADMQFLLWDAQRRMGISDELITRAMIEKLEINKTRQWPEPKDGEPLLHIKDMPAPVMPAELHPDTQNLAANFCSALAEKLYGAQLKYGYDADWKQDGWATQCLSHFHQHIAKGDPRDVAAYCAFMWYHGWKTESVSGPVVPDDGRAEFEAWMLKKWGRERQEYDFAMGKFLHGENYADSYTRHMWKAWTESRAAMLQSKYRDLSQPVDLQIAETKVTILFFMFTIARYTKPCSQQHRSRR